ncbi:universal stress protein [Chitinophaga horti]|uniref:Universal stress protein n=1 Tax=Chitinophaga horti TaxID=2920382 RepID=A0ABY6J827_9BACT|nr:universal stress protein [Chitinophaga horti]UYQ95757.1 universal stress protein [Chitinophaga horti]
MAKQFRTILVPVDFSVNTGTAIARALLMVPPDGATIHLLHVQRIGAGGYWRKITQFFRGLSWKQVRAAIKRSELKLLELKDAIEATTEHAKVEVAVCHGQSVEDTIIRKAIDLRADLLVLGKRSQHTTFPQLNTVVPSRIAQASGVPVLTAKPGALHSSLQKVVMPVSTRFPANKLALIAAIRRQRDLQVQLVIFADHDTDKPFPRQSLLAIFKILKGQAGGKVNYVVLHGRDKVKALLEYTRSIDADMVVVDPGAETKLTGWSNRHLSDMLPPHSKTMVLAVR